MNYLENIEFEVAGLDESHADNLDVDDVLASSITLVDFVIDSTGSMWDYEDAMNDCLEHYKQAIVNSKQADEMLVSKTLFNDEIKTGGYVAPEDFDTSYSAYGVTRLYDAIIDRRQRMLDYMEQLRDNGTNVRACMVILSDGFDNASNFRIGDARNAVQDLISKEITVAFVAFGQDAFGIAQSLGIKDKNVKEVNNNESELRKIIDLVSKSAISASKNANTGLTTEDGGFFDV